MRFSRVVLSVSSAAFTERSPAAASRLFSFADASAALARRLVVAIASTVSACWTMAAMTRANVAAARTAVKTAAISSAFRRTQLHTRWRKSHALKRGLVEEVWHPKTIRPPGAEHHQNLPEAPGSPATEPISRDSRRPGSGIARPSASA
jgi:hypothetical protein